MSQTLLFIATIIITLPLGIALSALWHKRNKLDNNVNQDVLEKLATNQINTMQNLHDFKDQLQSSLTESRVNFDKHQMQTMKILQDSLQSGMAQTREQVNDALSANTKNLTERVTELTKVTDDRLKSISGQVEKRLSDGFEKTTATFVDIVKRLAIIDEAQKKITELSCNVVSLQDLLSDKRSRGAFGEVQLNSLIRNVLPEQHFELQHTLSNNKRCDCILFLPKPTGNMVIDAKFPLESFKRLMDESLGESDRKIAEQQFRQDIKHHINDISSKYIIENETADGAIMFIPAEAVFAEIHAHYPDLIEASHRAKVWLVSPTTMMAILTTARAVLKDDATKKQVHVIQKHLQGLAKDFDRFQTRMDKLQSHIGQANDDVQKVNISARKITSRFQKIDAVELADENTKLEEF